MSGHESHGHEDLKIERPEITDEYLNKVNSRLHLSDEEEAIKKSIASGKLTPALEKEAHEILESNRRKRAGAEYEKERALREVNQLIEDKQKKQKELDELDDALREHAASGNFREAIKSKINHALRDMAEINRKLETNKENVADVEVIKDLNKARAEYAKEFKKYHKSVKTKKRVIFISNSITRFTNLFKRGDNKKDLLRDIASSECETTEFKEKKAAYEVARLVLANRMYERRKNELMYVGAKTREDALEELKHHSTPDFQPKNRDVVIEEFRVSHLPVFLRENKDKITNKLRIEFHQQKKDEGHSTREIIDLIKENDLLIAAGGYDAEIESRAIIQLDREIQEGKQDSEINRIIAEDLEKQKNDFDTDFEEKKASGDFDDEIDRIRIESGQIDPIEQIKRLKQYKAKEILQKTFFDEKKKLYEESGVPERGAALRLMHWYAKQPRWKRIAMSTALFAAGGTLAGGLTIFGGTAYAFSPFAFSSAMISKYGIASYAGMKFGLSALTAGAAAEGAKGIDLWNYRKDKEQDAKWEELKNKQTEMFTSGKINQQQYESQLERIQKKIDTRLQIRMRAKAWTGVGLGLGAGALSYNYIWNGLSVDHDHVDPPMTKGDHFKAPAPVQLEKTLDEFVVKADRIETVPTPPASISTGGDPVMLKYPDLNIDQTEFKNMEGGLATTSDLTPHTTADEFNPGNSNERILNQENPESGERLDLPETPGDATEPKIGGGTSPENTNTESGLNNTAGKGLKMDYHETQKIQENQLTELKNELGEKEYNKIIEDLESKNIPYKSDPEKFRTIVVKEDHDPNFARAIARNSLESQTLEQAGKVRESIGSSQVLHTHTYELPNGNWRNVMVLETEKIQDIAEQVGPESGERLDLPETPGDATEPKIGGGTSPENTNTESGLNNTAGKGLKMDYHETQKIQENQFQKIKSQIGNEEYEKLIKTLDNNMALYKTDINELRTIAVGENRDESFSRELALNNAREQLREQAGLKDAVFNDRGPSRVITSQLPNGEFRTIVVQAAHHVNNIEVDDLFNTENIPVTAEENVKAIINQSNQNAERFMALSGTDEGTMKSILTPKDSNHIRIVSERTSPDLAKAREMIVNDRMALNKVMGDDSVSMVGNSMDRIFKDSNGDYHVYRIYEIKNDY